MSFSSGVFSINTSGQPVVTGTVISSTVFNALTADLATGLSTCVLKDGTQTITGNIPMSSFKFTGLAAGSANGDSVRFEQLTATAQNGLPTYLTSVAGTNTVTGTATPTPAYAVGQRFVFVPAVTNTGAVTLNISSVGAGAVQWAGAALTGGEFVAGTPVTVLVTATTPVFEIINATQFPDTRALVVGGTDATKKLRFEVDGITTGTTRVVTIPDSDVTLLTGAATQAEQEAITSVTVATTPGRQQYHPSATKGWAAFGVTGNILLSYNVASITDVGTGRATSVWNVDFSGTSYAAFGTLSAGTALTALVVPATRAAGSVDFYSMDVTNTLTDPTDWSVVACGDQA